MDMPDKSHMWPQSCTKAAFMAIRMIVYGKLAYNITCIYATRYLPFGFSNENINYEDMLFSTETS